MVAKRGISIPAMGKSPFPLDVCINETGLATTRTNSAFGVSCGLKGLVALREK